MNDAKKCNYFPSRSTSQYETGSIEENLEMPPLSISRIYNLIVKSQNEDAA